MLLNDVISVKYFNVVWNLVGLKKLVEYFSRYFVCEVIIKIKLGSEMKDSSLFRVLQLFLGF